MLDNIDALYNSEFKIDDASFQILEEYDIVDVSKIVSKTASPSKLAESELISCMESKGIGTDASIAQHIKNIESRGYVELKTDDRREFQTSEFGKALAEGYMQIDQELIMPQIREFCIQT